MRLIDGDSLYASLEELYDCFGCEPREVHFSLLDMKMEIEWEETVDAEPVKYGHWINKGFEPVRCSVCGITGDAINGIPWAIKSFKYCPHCGAKMDEEE